MVLKNIKISSLEGNKGQIPGLPENPRLWDTADVERLASSLLETPLMTESRPMLVYPLGTKYVVLGGNLRLEAFRKNKVKEVPCILMGDVPLDRLGEIVMKDNSSFGDWDTDELANNWNEFPIADWGVNVAGLGEASEYVGTNNEIDTDDWKEDMTLKLRFSAEEMEWVRNRFAGKDPKKELLSALGYYGE